MTWYYSDAGKQRGPVSDEEFQQLVRTGVIQEATLVWHEGMADWQPCRQVTGAAPGTTTSPPGAPPQAGSGFVCAECGKSFKEDEIIQYSGRYICAVCKPVFLQRIQEGAFPTPGTGPGGISVEELLERDYTVSVSDSFGKAWKLMTSNFGTVVGSTFVIFLLLFICGVIPFVGVFFQLALQGALMGGLWLTILKQIRSGNAEVGDVFGGFGKRYWQLLLANLVQGLMMGVFIFPVAIMAALIIPGMAKSGSVGTWLVVVGGLGILAVFFGVLYLSTCWVFTIPLVADKGLSFWPAMELSRKMVNKHWGSIFLAVIVAGLFAGLGILGCGIGVFITASISIGMLAHIYEDIYGPLVRIER